MNHGNCLNPDIKVIVACTQCDNTTEDRSFDIKQTGGLTSLTRYWVICNKCGNKSRIRVDLAYQLCKENHSLSWNYQPRGDDV